MKFEGISYNDLFNQAAQNLVERTGITNLGSDSKAFTIISAFLNEDRNLVNQINNVLSSLKLGEAQGTDLDIIGEFVGQIRQPATRAFSKAIDNNVVLYVSSGTFGSINDGNNIVIPANEIIYLEDKDSTSGKRIEYRITSTTTLIANESSSSISVEAVELGSVSNVSTLTLLKHTFTNYTQSSSNTLRVRNNYAIVNGRDVQADESYRFVISKAWAAAAMANEISIRMAALSIPGVKDIRIEKWYNGIGTTGIIIDTFEGQISQTLLRNVKNRVEQFTAAGEIINAYAPKYIAIEITMIIQTRVELTSVDKKKLTSQIVNLIKNYINSFRLGQGFSKEALFSLVLRSNNQIVRIGRETGINELEEFNVYYIDQIGQYSKREYLFDDFSINSDQKIILLDTIPNPIHITIEKI